ncbi:MAG: MFS transporter, partial [Pyrinomonadaceae bacterium]|nr:MFS transporter [Pyrinomonadaceae bacterium]
AGVGMAFGLAQYFIGAGRLKNVGLPPVKSNSAEDSLSASYLLQMGAVFVAAAALIYSLELYGYSWKVTWIPIAVIASLIAVVMTGAQDKLLLEDWKRLVVIGILFTFSVTFWMGFEQAGSSLNLFAQDLTDRRIFGGWEFPAAYLQSVNSLFIVALAPVFSILWLRMGKRQPSDPIKFALGLFLLSVSFVVLAYASGLTGAGKVSPLWLVVVYLLQTMGELSLSPVGLSSMTKLAPAKMISLMLGVWFLSISLGNFLAGQIAGNFEPNQDVLVGLFSNVAIVTIIAAVLLVLITPFVKKLLVKSNQNVEQ